MSMCEGAFREGDFEDFHSESSTPHPHHPNFNSNHINYNNHNQYHDTSDYHEPYEQSPQQQTSVHNHSIDDESIIAPRFATASFSAFTPVSFNKSRSQLSSDIPHFPNPHPAAHANGFSFPAGSGEDAGASPSSLHAASRQQHSLPHAHDSTAAHARHHDGFPDRPQPSHHRAAPASLQARGHDTFAPTHGTPLPHAHEEEDGGTFEPSHGNSSRPHTTLSQHTHRSSRSHVSTDSNANNNNINNSSSSSSNNHAARRTSQSDSATTPWSSRSNGDRPGATISPPSRSNGDHPGATISPPSRSNGDHPGATISPPSRSNGVHLSATNSLPARSNGDRFNLTSRPQPDYTLDAATRTEHSVTSTSKVSTSEAGVLGAEIRKKHTDIDELHTRGITPDMITSFAVPRHLPLALAEPSQTYIKKQGYLWLLKSRLIKKSWKWRWCVLTPDRILTYKTAHDQVPCETIELKGWTLQDVTPTKGGEFTFVLEGPRASDFQCFATESLPELQEWSSTIEQGLWKLQQADCAAFGQPLERLLEDPNCSGRIPLPVERLMCSLNQTAVACSDLFAYLPNVKQVDKSKNLWQRNNFQFVGDQEKDAVIQVAILRRFFELLPTPILTTALMSRFLDLSEFTEQDQMCEALKMLIVSLPAPNQSLFFVLIEFLYQLCCYHRSDQMVTDAAMYFAPVIFRLPDNQSLSPDLEHASVSVLSFIIVNYRSIWSTETTKESLEIGELLI